MLRKTVGNWVDGDRFFDREADIADLRERVREGTHTLITAQRRKGKTSLVRELLRQLHEAKEAECIFVDLEDARDAADAIVEIGLQTRHMQPVWQILLDTAARTVQHVEDVQLSELRIRLRNTIDSGNWKHKGNDLFNILADQERLVLAIDELPLLINRILKGSDSRKTEASIQDADEFLSWLRRNAQQHRDRICLILSGSVGIAPILKDAGLSATMNVFSAYDLRPWDTPTACQCLAELASSYDIDLPSQVQEAMCRRLRSCIPHHIQQFFDALHRHLRLQGKQNATLRDAEAAYREDMLGTRGRIDMDHYEDRLKLILGIDAYRVALALLAETATTGYLDAAGIRAYSDRLRASGDGGSDRIPHVIDVLEHDGYLVKEIDRHEFASGLLRDWWRARAGHAFLPFTKG